LFLSSHLFGVSGSGKTRLSLDGLCSHWGLYISCRTWRTTGDTASGSDDFAVAMKMMQSMSTWGINSPDLSKNSSTASRTFAMLLCARFFILKRFVQHLPRNTAVTDARRRWVLAQVLPPRLNFEDDDLFVKVLLSLRNGNEDIMMRIVRSSLRNIMDEREDLFPTNSKPFIVIDEAQVAAEYLRFFRSGSGNDRRPILREMVGSIHSFGIFHGIILSGTGLSMKTVKDTVGSFPAKQMDEVGQTRVFTNIGRFTRDDSSQKDYIHRYLTLSNDVISDQRLLERMIYWFSGRYVYYLALQDSFSSLV
jgi:hypothetical protein